ncbi:MAG: T9SS type A sorting domain-containing protein, partial [Bacteroidetes bacterium]|nr:T9SS type A sorting domain-containing protein [Bacteroidota bacterium]
TGFVAVSGGDYHSLALKNDGTIWAWGLNNSGQLGDGTTIERHCPVQVTGLTDVIAIACGGYFSLALKNDGTVWAWGVGGLLGDGTTIQRHTPVQASGLTDIVSVTCGEFHSLALKNDGTVWAWGGNGNGQLGDGTTTDQHSPVQPGISGIVTALSSGSSAEHTVVLKDDGTAWAWGWNSSGQLGDGTFSTLINPNPVQVIGLCVVPTEVNEITEQNNVWCYPNPTAGVFHFQFGNKENAIKNVTITDVTGRIIFFTNQNKNEVHLSFAAAGIYFYSVVTKEGNVFKGKLVKE